MIVTVPSQQFTCSFYLFLYLYYIYLFPVQFWIILTGVFSVWLSRIHDKMDFYPELEGNSATTTYICSRGNGKQAHLQHLCYKHSKRNNYPPPAPPFFCEIKYINFSCTNSKLLLIYKIWLGTHCLCNVSSVSSSDHVLRRWSQPNKIFLQNMQI